MTSGEAVAKAVGILSHLLARPLVIVETGSVRGETQNYRVNDGYSTLHVAEWVKENGGVFHSIDCDTSTAEKVLAAAGLSKHVTLHKATAFEELERMRQPVDFAYLDSSNSSTNNLREFLAVDEMGAQIVMIDDCYDGEEVVNKGRLSALVAEPMGYKAKRVGDRMILLARKNLDDRALAQMDSVEIDPMI